MLVDHLLGDALRVAVVLSVALLAMPVLRRASAATRRLVLAMALGGALVMPFVSAAVPAWRVPAPAAVASLRAVLVAEPLAPATAPTAVVSREATAPVSSSPVAAARAVDLPTFVACVWAAGAALVLARLLVGTVRTRRIVRRATRAPAWSLAAARSSKATGLRVDVRATGELDAPAVAGVLSPVILVPHASASWTDERRHAVLLHELAHVRQGDCLAHLVAQLACAMHWFNPLAWIAARRLRAERELAADDAVVAGGARASSYAEDLLAIAGAVDVPRDVPAGALGMAEPSLLAARVTAIVSAGRLRRPPSAVSAALLAASVGAGVIGLACATPEAVTATKNDPSVAAAPGVRPVLVGSTLDPRLQGVADEELRRAMEQWKAASGTVLIVDPSTGEILANAGREHDTVVDVAVSRVFVPGSTLKAVTLAGALEEGVVTPTESIDCEHGSWTYRGQAIHDAHENGVLTVPELLAVSSNIGFAKIYDRLGGDREGRWLRAFHFGTPPAIEGAAAGTIPARIDERSGAGALVAIGEGITTSPLQIAAAYAALANGGFYVAPTLTRRTGDAPREALVKPETARTVVTMLEGVVDREHATGTLARVDGQRVAGKTGTAGWTLPDGTEGVYASFVGIVPSTSPRYVILVGLEQPQGEDANGPGAAAPLFSRVATRALAR